MIRIFLLVLEWRGANLSARSQLLNCPIYGLATSRISGCFSTLAPSSWQQTAPGWWNVFSDPAEHSWSEDKAELKFQAERERLGSAFLLVEAKRTEHFLGLQRSLSLDDRQM